MKLFPHFTRHHLITHTNSPTPIEAAVYAVTGRWAHETFGTNSPAECSIAKQVLGATKRLLGKPVQGKQSVNVNLVTKVAKTFNTPQASLSNLRTCFIFINAFAGPMRCDVVIRHQQRSYFYFF